MAAASPSSEISYRTPYLLLTTRGEQVLEIMELGKKIVLDGGLGHHLFAIRKMENGRIANELPLLFESWKENEDGKVCYKRSTVPIEMAGLKKIWDQILSSKS